MELHQYQIGSAISVITDDDKRPYIGNTTGKCARDDKHNRGHPARAVCTKQRHIIAAADHSLRSATIKSPLLDPYIRVGNCVLQSAVGQFHTGGAFVIAPVIFRVAGSVAVRLMVHAIYFCMICSLPRLSLCETSCRSVYIFAPAAITAAGFVYL